MYVGSGGIERKCRTGKEEWHTQLLLVLIGHLGDMIHSIDDKQGQSDYIRLSTVQSLRNILKRCMLHLEIV